MFPGLCSQAYVPRLMFPGLCSQAYVPVLISPCLSPQLASNDVVYSPSYHTPTQHTLPRRPSGDNTDDGNPVARLSEDESSFCQRFQLSPEELPLPSWVIGKRCTMIDRDKPLIGSKSGKLYLTHRLVE